MQYTIVAAHPPLLDGKKYSYWKVKVKIYIKAIDEKAWHAILTVWDAWIILQNTHERTPSVKISKL